MRRGRRYLDPKQILFYKSCFVFMMLLITVILVDSRIRPVIKTMSSYQAQVYATQVINDAVLEELTREGVTYGDLVTLTRNEKGEVTAIQTDMTALNRMRANITNTVLYHVANLENQDITIPIGSLTGVQILSGRGPKVKFHVMPAGYLLTDYENRFDSAGINQTRHQILLNMTMNVTAIVPGYSVTTEVKTSYCLAETVIVGYVPQSFTEVTGDDRSNLSKIFDFGAGRGNGAALVQ